MGLNLALIFVLIFYRVCSIPHFLMSNLMPMWLNELTKNFIRVWCSSAQNICNSFCPTPLNFAHSVLLRLANSHIPLCPYFLFICPSVSLCCHLASLLVLGLAWHRLVMLLLFHLSVITRHLLLRYPGLCSEMPFNEIHPSFQMITCSFFFFWRFFL